MVKVLATMVVNDNKVQFIEESSKYFIAWGDIESEILTKTEIKTPSGRKISQKSAHKKFLEACKASQYLKFSRL